MRRARFQASLLFITAVAVGTAHASPQGVHQAELQKVLASDGLAGDQFGSAAAMHGLTAVVGAPLHDHGGLTDCGAAYVYVFDGTSWSEEAELVAADAQNLDQFGVSVDVDNDTIVVGAWKDNNQNGPRAGAAYVFVRSGTSWSQQAKLVASDGDPEDELGRSVAVWGKGLLVGAYHDDDAGIDSGSAYVFVGGGASWFQAQKLVAADAAAGDEFGASVGLDGPIAAAGAPGDAGEGGAAYVYEHDGTALIEWVKLTAPTPDVGDLFGASVSVSNDRVLIGSPRMDGAVPTLGRAFVWARIGTSWTLQDTLDALGPDAGEQLGTSVALDGDTALAGAPLHDLFGASVAGAVYAFRSQGAGWPFLGRMTAGDAEAGDRYGSSVALAADRVLVGARLDDDAAASAGSAYFFRMVPLATTLHEVKLVAADAASSDNFGLSVAVDGDTAVIGAYLDDDAGSAYVFVRSGTSWSEQAKLVAPDAGAGDWFGSSVAVEGDVAVIGAPLDDTVAGVQAGSVYIFVRSGTSWLFEDKLRAADGSAGDRFGISASISGSTAVFGAYRDDNAGSSNSGSAYVFVRSGTSWGQEAKLVAADTADFDEFGRSIALDGDTAVVGAPWDDHVGVGADAGSAYVFVRSGTSWNQEAKLVPADAAVFDEFGQSIAIDGDTLVVGSHRDDDAGSDTGSAYVFIRSGTSWSQQAKLVPAEAAVFDEFGQSIALHGDTIAVGSHGDDDAGNGSGSAHVFVRSGTSWSPQTKLVPADGAAFDQFGSSVAVDRDTVVVGSPYDDDAGFSSGSAYVFTPTITSPSFCNAADGSHAACPCGNPGNPDSGCDIAQGTGGVRLDVTAQRYVPENRATLIGTGYPPASNPTAIVIRANLLDPAAPVVFGDGLRCVGTPVVRLSGHLAVAGSSIHAFGHGAMGGTFYYQLWFRNQPAMFCNPDAFNLSNGRALAW